MCDIEGDHECDGLGDELDAASIPQNVYNYFKLPENIKNRVKALKNLQHKTIEIDLDFYRRLYALEKEFESRHQEILMQRAAIIEGKVEPTKEQCQFEDTVMEEYKKVIDEIDKLTIEEISDSNVTGIPQFWLKALMHDSDIGMMIMEHDKPVLEHLTDIRCELAPENFPGFTLYFHFSPNEWFANEKLSKTYFFSYEIPKDDPLNYSGPEIIACQGCAIDWNKGKDLTQKQESKVQKNKHRPGEKRVVVKTVQKDSFFNYFNAEKMSIDNDEADSDFLELDFKIGQFIRETLIPRAVLYFTGEASNDGDDSDDDDFLDEDDDEEDDDDIDDEPHLAKPRQHHRGKRNGPNNNEECKQQ